MDLTRRSGTCHGGVGCQQRLRCTPACAPHPRILAAQRPRHPGRAAPACTTRSIDAEETQLILDSDSEFGDTCRGGLLSALVLCPYEEQEGYARGETRGLMRGHHTHPSMACRTTVMQPSLLGPRTKIDSMPTCQPAAGQVRTGSRRVDGTTWQAGRYAGTLDSSSK